MPATRPKDKYGAAHKRLCRQLLDQLARTPGLPCSRCGGPMYPGQALHLDHADDGSGRYLGLSHAACNTGAGQKQTTMILHVKGYQLTPRQKRAMLARKAALPVSGGRPSGPSSGIISPIRHNA